MDAAASRASSWSPLEDHFQTRRPPLDRGRDLPRRGVSPRDVLALSTSAGPSSRRRSSRTSSPHEGLTGARDRRAHPRRPCSREVARLTMPQQAASASHDDLPCTFTLRARSTRGPSGLIPAGTQTLAKGPGQFVRGVAPKYLARGRGARVWDVDGNEYLDFSMGVGPLSLGYGYPAVDEAIRAQLEDGITFSLMHPLEVEVAELVRRGRARRRERALQQDRRRRHRAPPCAWRAPSPAARRCSAAATTAGTTGTSPSPTARPGSRQASRDLSFTFPYNDLEARSRSRSTTTRPA